MAHVVAQHNRLHTATTCHRLTARPTRPYRHRSGKAGQTSSYPAPETCWSARRRRADQHETTSVDSGLDRTRGGSYIGIFIMGVGMFAIYLFLTYYMQLVLGYSPLKTGVAFLPMVVSLGAAAIIIPALVMPRIGAKITVGGGFTTAAAGLILRTRMGPGSSYTSNILPGLVLLGIGVGIGCGGLSGLDVRHRSDRRRSRVGDTHNHAAGGRLHWYRTAEYNCRHDRDRVHTWEAAGSDLACAGPDRGLCYRFLVGNGDISRLRRSPCCTVTEQAEHLYGSRHARRPMTFLFSLISMLTTPRG
ncbi:hypothetical protein CRH09_26515 [Nocardia terpenica]|uniref:MFS transporter n=1 Tax=Nocardia terpenica TaxID=455432 RepID=A0A291RPF8_9NOCA|nr:hypothetical protein CRH09_26515 [Nocardia terpenica]